MKNSTKIIIVSILSLIVIAYVTASLVVYVKSAEEVITENYVDDNIHILNEVALIGDKTVEFAECFDVNGTTIFGMIIYDPTADNLYTNDCDKFDKYTLITENRVEYALVCKNKCKQFFIYEIESDALVSDTEFIIRDTKLNECKIILKKFNGNYDYLKSNSGITVRALYQTNGSRIFLYDAYIEKEHPLIKYLRSNIKNYTADTISYILSEEKIYDVHIKGDGGECSFNNDIYNKMQYRIPKSFGVFFSVPDNIGGQIKIINFEVKYFVDIFSFLQINNIAKDTGMTYNSDLFESNVWEREITQKIN